MYFVEQSFVVKLIETRNTINLKHNKDNFADYLVRYYKTTTCLANIQIIEKFPVGSA